MSGWLEDALIPPKPWIVGWLLILGRGGVFGVLTYLGLGVLLLVRLVERPVFGAQRPWTPFITQFVCKSVFRIIGLPVNVTGKPMALRGAIVANHASWLDIFALNAAQRIYFVAKAEVAHWAAIGWLARATGTVFIARKGTESKAQQVVFEDRLQAGHRLLFFPEGTSTDSIRILPFKSTLFAAFFNPALRDILHVQPVTVRYHAPEGQDPRYYGWWGDMGFATHLMKVLATLKQGRVEVIFHDPLAVRDFADRKALAAECERRVRRTLA